jgi:hypothetical protein
MLLNFSKAISKRLEAMGVPERIMVRQAMHTCIDVLTVAAEGVPNWSLLHDGGFRVVGALPHRKFA